MNIFHGKTNTVYKHRIWKMVERVKKLHGKCVLYFESITSIIADKTFSLKLPSISIFSTNLLVLCYAIKQKSQHATTTTVNIFSINSFSHFHHIYFLCFSHFVLFFFHFQFPMSFSMASEYKLRIYTWTCCVIDDFQ